MKVCIFGTGAIGGYVGAMLAQGGAAVSLIARGPIWQRCARTG
jgi:2-dehydropantoate 2-reductase